jgi:hypothetical protein
MSISIYTAADIMQRPLPGWLIEPILPEGALGMLFGPPGVGKTFLALGFAKAVAAGEDWLNHPVRPGTVLYVAAEGAGGLRKRLEALDVPKDTPSALFVIEPVYLSTKEHRDELRQQLEARGALASVRLIVIDTLAMSFTGDENSSQDIGGLMRGASELRAKTGATILFVHHSVKASAGRKNTPRERGSSALLGAVDTAMVLTEYNDQLRLICKKQKDAAPFEAIDLRLVATGASCTVKAGDAFPDKHLSPTSLKALKALWNASALRGLTAKEWREGSGIAESSLFKAISELRARSYVEQTGDKRYFVTAEGNALFAPTPQKLSA